MRKQQEQGGHRSLLVGLRLYTAAASVARNVLRLWRGFTGTEARNEKLSLTSLFATPPSRRPRRRIANVNASATTVMPSSMQGKGDSPMTVRVKFGGGPLHGQNGHVASLPQCQIFFDERQRQVFCYVRVDELYYVYEADISRGLTGMYDEAYSRFGKTGQSVQSWGEKRSRT